MAQVHGATDAQGNEWVVKVLKPRSRERLTESVEALEAVCTMVEPLALTLVARRALKELRELSAGLRREMDLAAERDTIISMRERLGKGRQKVLRIPGVHPALGSAGVLVMERFRGTALSAIVSGQAALSPALRQKLAKRVLHELLVQVFEVGLFHGDPHAGNLMLLETGEVGLFDWGLAAELEASDRRHIAAILRSVLALDVEALVDALMVMAEDGGKKVSRSAVRKELAAVIKMAKDGQGEGAKKPSLRELFETSLNGAERLGIPVPQGLLMMAKSLMTIEGLARGLDPDVSMLRIATPVLFRAASPGFKDFVSLAAKLPFLARRYFGS